MWPDKNLYFMYSHLPIACLAPLSLLSSCNTGQHFLVLWLYTVLKYIIKWCTCTLETAALVFRSKIQEVFFLHLAALSFVTGWSQYTAAEYRYFIRISHVKSTNSAFTLSQTENHGNHCNILTYDLLYHLFHNIHPEKNKEPGTH